MPRDVLMPVILLFCIVGAFAINNTAFDVGVMLIAGLVAYLLEENGFPITPLILGVVLGGMLEENFVSSMIKSDGNVLAFFEPADRRDARRADDRDLVLAAAAAAPPSPAADDQRGAPRAGAQRARAGGMRTIGACSSHAVDSRYAWGRLVVALVLMTIGSSAMYVVAVVLPSVQAEFGTARADASLPYTLLMVGFGIGGVFMGRLADRRGIVVPLLIGAAGLGVGFVAAGAGAGNIWTFAIVHGVLLGLVGSSASFAPLVADTSLWFERRRGIAVAICASGNYVAGAIWPPIVQHFVESVGWRQTYIGLGIFSALTMATLALFMRGRPPALARGRRRGRRARGRRARRGRSACRRARRRRCSASPASPAASRCRCRRSTSSPTAATSATARRAARRCCR